jgi:hypothetical protein
MLYRRLGLALLLGVALSPGAGRAQSAPVLKSVTVDLPAGDRMFPGGAEADVVNNDCLACRRHGA